MLRLRISRPVAALVWMLPVSLLLCAICIAGAGFSSSIDLAMAGRIGALLCALLLWQAHLALDSSRWVFSLAAVSIAAWEISTRLHDLTSSLQLLGLPLAYVALWTYSAYDRNPGLQPVATMALVTCAAVLANPTVAIGCTVLAIGSFALHRHQAFGGRLGFAFLLFTPATLCVFAVLMLGFLGAGNLGAYPLASRTGLQPETGIPFDWWVVASGQALLPVAILCARAVSRRVGSADLLFVLMLAIPALGKLWFPTLCNLTGVWLMALGGSAFLLTSALDREAKMESH